MESRAKLIDYGVTDLNTVSVTFEVKDLTADIISPLINKDLDLKAVVHREKRSLNANAYFHKLVGMIADEMVISKAKVKNDLISSYGQPEMIDNEPMIYKTNAPESYMEEREEIHTKLVKVTMEKGKQVNFYKVFRGSHTYNSKEMSILIDGTVQQAKDLGLETLPPSELERMVNEWQSQ